MNMKLELSKAYCFNFLWIHVYVCFLITDIYAERTIEVYVKCNTVRLLCDSAL